MCGSRLTGRNPSWQARAISGRSKVGRGADVTRAGSSLIGVIGSIQIRLGIVPEGCRGICLGPIEMSFLATREWIMQPVDRLTVHVVVDNTTDMLSSRPKHVASELRVLRDAGMDGARGRGALLGPPWALPGGLGASGQ